jgi:hypothetical protein
MHFFFFFFGRICQLGLYSTFVEKIHLQLRWDLLTSPARGGRNSRPGDPPAL